MGLHLLRKNIVYIPQFPFILSGTISENLDPFKEYTDTDIILALREAQLLDYIQTLKHGI
jgi:ABC-type multidrug transport system fused ATPase/permease subunit